MVTRTFQVDGQTYHVYDTYEPMPLDLPEDAILIEISVEDTAEQVAEKVRKALSR